MSQQPRLIAVGVGPGDPELLTLKGARLIREADVVVTPIGDRSETSIAHGIIRDLVDPRRQQLLTQVYPMKKDPAEMEASWQASAAEVAQLVRAGKTVVFITIGDPLLYSTFLYLYRILRSDYPDVAIELVPGISSIFAAAAAAGVPLGLAADRIAVLPATFEAEKLRQTLLDFDTVVLMKVSRVFDRVRTLVRELGCRATYVKRVGLASEAVFHDLEAVGEEDLDYLSLVIVRKGDHPPAPS
ncbi:MAG: precorrin-2 C(20)-methyltransferase [Trichloromonadaceae bacterium]